MFKYVNSSETSENCIVTVVCFDGLITWGKCLKVFLNISARSWRIEKIVMTKTVWDATASKFYSEYFFVFPTG